MAENNDCDGKQGLLESLENKIKGESLVEPFKHVLILYRVNF